MRILLQRVNEASVKVNDATISSIQKGMLILLGIHKKDTDVDLDYMIQKVINLRIFPNTQGKFDRSVLDIDGDILYISN